MPRIRAVKPKKRGRRQLQTPNEEVRDRIFEAAALLIADGGFPVLRIDELASKAGISVGTFYLYFEGKDDLFVQLVDSFTQQLRERFHVASKGGGTVVERLEYRLDAYLDFVEENRRGFQYFRDSGAVETTGGRLSTWAMGVHAQDLRPLLEEGMAAGELRPMDSDLLAHAMVGLLQHMAGVWLDNHGSVSRHELRAFVDGLIAFGIRPIEEPNSEERG
ncbi:MAG TPA: TetR/AcrR family transcriptional regulator [Acidimicrobiales bacterium]|jgi:AcrR family transcriptional regulator|nr:TetR/AcrR family transcriptional regulator [Acidimicrobiales bacterium]